MSWFIYIPFRTFYKLFVIRLAVRCFKKTKRAAEGSPCIFNAIIQDFFLGSCNNNTSFFEVSIIKVLISKYNSNDSTRCCC